MMVYWASPGLSAFLTVLFLGVVFLGLLDTLSTLLVSKIFDVWSSVVVITDETVVGTVLDELLFPRCFFFLCLCFCFLRL